MGVAISVTSDTQITWNLSIDLLSVSFAFALLASVSVSVKSIKAFKWNFLPIAVLHAYQCYVLWL